MGCILLMNEGSQSAIVVCKSKLIVVLSRTIKDGRVISIMHKYLNTGVITNGMLGQTQTNYSTRRAVKPIA